MKKTSQIAWVATTGVVLPGLLLVIELVKQSLFPASTLWQSTIVTIVAASALATVVVALLAFRTASAKPAQGADPEPAQPNRSNEALKTAEAKYRSIFENAVEGIFQTTPEGQFLAVNSAMARILGFASPSELISQRTDIARQGYVDPQRRETFKDLIKEHGVVNHFEYEVYRKDGSKLWVSENARAVRGDDGRVRYFEGSLEDISERVRAEEALRESRQRLESIINSVEGIVWEADAATFQFTFVSHKAEQILGYPVDRWLSEPAFWRDHLHPADRDWAVEFCIKATHELRPHEFEYRMIAADGREVWLKDIVTLAGDPGQTLRLRGILVDITASKRAEADLQASKSLLETVMNNIPQGVFWKDRDSRYLGCNRVVARAFGFETPEQMVGNTDFASVGLRREQAAFFVQKDREVMESRVAQLGIIEEATLANGATIWMETNKIPLRDADGEVIGVLGTWQDITERKLAATALAESNQKLQSLIQVAPFAMLIVDADATVQMWNPSAERIFGWSAGEVLGKPLPYVPADRQAEFHGLLADGLKGKRQLAREVVRMRKDGSPVELSLWSAPLCDGQGRINSVLAFLVDNTERKSLELQLRQAQKMEAVGRLAGGVAHDFNNLLTVISGYTEILLKDLVGDERRKNMVVEIRKAGERAASLTRQLLAFSRKQVLAPKVLDLNAIVAESEKMLKRLVGEDVRLAVKLNPSLAHVKTDVGQLEQALMNLVVNARDAMPQGGTITIETANVDLDEDYCRSFAEVKPGRYVMLALSDTGCGMDEPTMVRIFEPFFTTKEPGKGTGLGLAMVHGFIKQSGGHVSVSSEVGKGSSFKVYLPEVQVVRTLGKSRFGQKKMPQGSETILLVEDDVEVRVLTYQILQSCGYTVLAAAHGAEAIQMAEKHQGTLHLLLSDVVMPGMGGRQVAERVKALKPAIKVLYLSGYTDDAVVRHGVLESETAFLQKPFTPALLANKVREVLDQ
jgi:two-component system, cell cycle sensor histidine kinase and response regulator CckA